MRLRQIPEELFEFTPNGQFKTSIRGFLREQRMQGLYKAIFNHLRRRGPLDPSQIAIDLCLPLESEDDTCYGILSGLGGLEEMGLVTSYPITKEQPNVPPQIVSNPFIGRIYRVGFRN